MDVDFSTMATIEFSPDCRINVEDDTVLAQVAANIRRGLPQAMPYQPNDSVAVIIAGGPSLAESEEEIRRASLRPGHEVVALNGAYQWLIDHDIRPNGMMMLDAREFNTRFLETPVAGCTYFIASQCHPRAFELCRDRKVVLFHACSLGDVEYELLKAYYWGRCNPVTGGTTVGIRAISLMRMLGYQRMEMFGFDSCYLDDAHHAYRQAENDVEGAIPVYLRPEGDKNFGIKFLCAPWMVKQAYDFMELVEARGDDIDLNVHGPGLIATMIRTGAELSTEGD